MPALIVSDSDLKKRRSAAKRVARRSMRRAAKREEMNAAIHDQYPAGWSPDRQAPATPVQQHLAIYVNQYFEPGQAPTTYSTYFVVPGDMFPPHHQDLSCASVEAGSREGLDERVEQMAKFESEAAGSDCVAKALVRSAISFKANKDAWQFLALDEAGLCDQVDDGCAGASATHASLGFAGNAFAGETASNPVIRKSMKSLGGIGLQDKGSS